MDLKIKRTNIEFPTVLSEAFSYLQQVDYCVSKLKEIYNFCNSGFDDIEVKLTELDTKVDDLNLSEITELVNEVKDSVDFINTKAEQFDNDIATLNSEISSLTNSLNAQAQSLTKLTTDLSVISDSVYDNDSGLVALKTLLDTLSESLTALSGAVATDVKNLQNAIDAVDARVDTVDTKVDTVDTKVDTVDTKVDTVDTKVDTVSGNVESLSSNVLSNTTSINAIQTSLSTQMPMITGRINSLETATNDLPTMRTNIDNLQTSLNALSQTVDGLIIRLENYETNMSTLSKLSTRVESLENQIVSIGGTITIINTNISNLNNRCDGFDTDVSDLNGKASELKEKVDNITTTLQTLSYTVNQHTISINNLQTNLNSKYDEILNNYYGCKNLVRYVTLNTFSKNGLTFTPNFDSHGLLSSWNINGTSTNSGSVVLANFNDMLLYPSRDYKLFGCFDGDADSYYLEMMTLNGNETVSVCTTSVTEPFNMSYDQIQDNGYLFFTHDNNITINTTIMPMLYDADFSNAVYCPPILSNAELTTIVNGNGFVYDENGKRDLHLLNVICNTSGTTSLNFQQIANWLYLYGMSSVMMTMESDTVKQQLCCCRWDRNNSISFFGVTPNSQSTSPGLAITTLLMLSSGQNYVGSITIN